MSHYKGTRKYRNYDGYGAYRSHEYQKYDKYYERDHAPYQNNDKYYERDHASYQNNDKYYERDHASYQNNDKYYERDHVSNQNNDLLGPVSNSRAVNGEGHDPVFDAEVNALLDEFGEDIVEDPLRKPETNDSKADLDDVKEQYEDYYHEFPPEIKHEQSEIPSWYKEKLDRKIRETKSRLNDLSSVVCIISKTTRDYIARIESDHNTPFCKLDPSSHPSLKEPWTNYWRFNCVTKCRLDPTIEHDHTVDCEVLMLEHVGTSTTTKSDNIFPSEFPSYIMRTVELFQKFVVLTSKMPRNSCELVDSKLEVPKWSFIKIRSNYKKELQLTVSGRDITPYLNRLKNFFKSEEGRTCNVVSLYCVNERGFKKKSNIPPTFLCGNMDLRDKVGPITMYYTPKTSINFNSVEAIQLGRVMKDFLEPTPDTTLIEIGCNIGAISLMLSHKCDKVIGLNPLQYEVEAAETIKSENEIRNASFIICQPKDFESKCNPLVKRCMSVAILNLATPFGKNHLVYRALRTLPTVWRVVVYGTFAKDFYKLISLLTSDDSDLGDQFMPVRGCVVDKSPSLANAFDIVVLFERKSLIEPSVKYIKSINGTYDVNDFANSNDGSNFPDERNYKFHGKLERPDDLTLFVPETSAAALPSPSTSSRGNELDNSRAYGCPSLPNNLIKPKIEKPYSPRSPQRRSESEFLEKSRPTRPSSASFNQTMINADPRMSIKREPLPFSEPSSTATRQESSAFVERPLITPKSEKPFDQQPDLSNTYNRATSRNPPFPARPHQESASRPTAPQVAIKKEKEWSADQLARLHGQPPLTIKKEKEFTHDPPASKQPSRAESVTVKSEPREQNPVESGRIKFKIPKLSAARKGGEPSSNANRNLGSATVKSEPVSAGSPCSTVATGGAVVKNEPINNDDDDDEPVFVEPPPVKIEQIEIRDDDPSDVFANMMTPRYTPASPTYATSNFETFNGFRYADQPNQPFYDFELPEPNTQVHVKQEKGVAVEEEPLDEQSHGAGSKLQEKIKSLFDDGNSSEDDLHRRVEQQVAKKASSSYRHRSPSHSSKSPTRHRGHSSTPSSRHRRSPSSSSDRYARSGHSKHSRSTRRSRSRSPSPPRKKHKYNKRSRSPSSGRSSESPGSRRNRSRSRSPSSKRHSDKKKHSRKDRRRDSSRRDADKEKEKRREREKAKDQENSSDSSGEEVKVKEEQKIVASDDWDIPGLSSL